MEAWLKANPLKVVEKWVPKMIDNVFDYTWRYYTKHPCQIFKDAYGWIKAFIQRGLYGYSYRDWWSLDWYLASWLPSALRDITDKGIGYPGMDVEGNEITPEMWHDILYEMAEGFEALKSMDDIEWETIEELREKNALAKEKIDKALQLFTKHFYNLWD